MRRKESCGAFPGRAQVKANSGMLFGHNSNVKADGTTYHVQTEDRGAAHALIDTIVYFSGRVLHRRTNNYFDLLPLNTESEKALKRRIDEQHHTVVEGIRTGTLRLALPHEEKSGSPTLAAPHASSPQVLHLELVNAKTWLSGKRALLKVAVRNGAHLAVGGATVRARVEGAAEAAEFSVQTGDFGQAEFEFDMPRLAGADSALVIEALHGNSKGVLRFQLRGKPRIPSAS